MSAGIGVYKPNVDKQSRINWLTDARTLLEGESIPWAFFNDMGDFSGPHRDRRATDLRPLDSKRPVHPMKSYIPLSHFSSMPTKGALTRMANRLELKPQSPLTSVARHGPDSIT